MRAFWTAVALVILGLYCVFTGYMIYSVARACTFEEACAAGPATTFNDGFLWTVTATTGLVSALVTALLGLTRPGGMPSLAPMDGGAATALSRGVAVAYVVAWLVFGVAALVVGQAMYPDANTTLADMGRTWLGGLVAAFLAYVGIDPQRAAGAPTAARTN